MLRAVVVETVRLSWACDYSSTVLLLVMPFRCLLAVGKRTYQYPNSAHISVRWGSSRQRQHVPIQRAKYPEANEETVHRFTKGTEWRPYQTTYFDPFRRMQHDGPFHQTCMLPSVCSRKGLQRYRKSQHAGVGRVLQRSQLPQCYCRLQSSRLVHRLGEKRVPTT